MSKPRSAAVLLIIVLLMLPAVGYAHLVELLSSFPENGAVLRQSPEVITAVFNEEMQSSASYLQVFDSASNQVNSGGVDLNDPNHASMLVNVPTLAEGAYTVRWQVTLLDGDATTGAFNFFVGDKAAATAANFAPLANGIGAAATAVPNNTPWLVAGILVSVLFLGGAFFMFNHSKRTASP